MMVEVLPGNSSTWRSTGSMMWSETVSSSLTEYTPGSSPEIRISPVLIGGAVQIPVAVFNFSDTEGHAGQPGTVRAQLDEVQGGLDGVGEHEPGRLVGLQLDDTLGLVDDVAGALQLGDHIGPGGQLRQVDFAVLVGGELRRPQEPSTASIRNLALGITLDGSALSTLTSQMPGFWSLKKYSSLMPSPAFSSISWGVVSSTWPLSPVSTSWTR